MSAQELHLVSYAELGEAWKLSPRTVARWVSEDEKAGIKVPRIRRRLDGHRYVVLMRIQVAEALLSRHMPGLMA